MVPVILIDAFTSEPFSGNPAAVCLLPVARDIPWMQKVAREMNLSETAFLVRRSPTAADFDLRWFTPTAEVDLCGHATLASAHALWEAGALRGDDVARFHTRSGLLTATREAGWITLDFPATPEQRADPPVELGEALGVRPKHVGRSRFDYLVEVEAEDDVRNARPDFAALRRLPVRGVMITARANTPGVDFVSRFFAPAFGIDEDPVTGSAHCCLAPFWGRRLNKTEMMARQLSARGGTLRLRLVDDRVLLSGQAITVVRGDLLA